MSISKSFKRYTLVFALSKLVHYMAYNEFIKFTLEAYFGYAAYFSMIDIN